jgi:hypothetical protein
MSPTLPRSNVVMPGKDFPWRPIPSPPCFFSTPSAALRAATRLAMAPREWQYLIVHPGRLRAVLMPTQTYNGKRGSRTACPVQAAPPTTLNYQCRCQLFKRKGSRNEAGQQELKKKPTKSKDWSDFEKRQLAKLVRTRIGAREISIALGRHIGSVRKMAREMRLILRKKGGGLLEEG